MTQQQQQQQQQQRRRQQQDEIVGGDDDDGDDDGACDESKCVSTGMGRDFNLSFTCYTDDDDYYYPMMCADGFKPRVVESEPPAFSDMSNDDYWASKSYQYFTCCPPKLSAETNVNRHCSDPIVNSIESINNNGTSMICNDDTRPYPREMKTRKFQYFNREEVEVESYMCCDSAENKTANFLHDTKCVPYRDEFYQEASARNMYGYINAMTCDFSNGDFQFPNIVPTNDGSYYTYYKCCKTGSKQPFVQDAAFKKTVYPQIVISSFAVISCIIVIVGLSIPLLMQMRRRRTQTTQRANRLARAGDESDYSTYNLYLVYLAIPDLILNLYLLGMYGSYANQKYNPKSHGTIIYNYVDSILNEQATNFEGAFVVACSTANLYLNAVVSYEVLVLLRNNHQVRRTNPPSLLKVTLQAVAVYVFAILVFVIHYYIDKAISVASVDSDYDKYFYLVNVNLVWSLVVTYILPIGFFVCVSIIICCRGYMPSATGRMKELAWYFFRIIVIFCVLWIPGMLLLVIGAADTDSGGVSITIGLLVCAIQPIVSMCMAMTKTDVRKYIFDLVTLSYIRKSKATTIATAPAAAPATATATTTATAITQEKKSSTVLETKEETCVETPTAKDADGILATLTKTATTTNASPTTTTTMPETKEN